MDGTTHDEQIDCHECRLREIAARQRWAADQTLGGNRDAMTYLLLQTFLLLLAAYFAGAFTACLIKRAMMGREVAAVATGASAGMITDRYSEALGTQEAGLERQPFTPLEPRPFERVQPKIDIIERPEPRPAPPIADISRFDRALSGPDPNEGMPRIPIVELHPAVFDLVTGPPAPWPPPRPEPEPEPLIVEEAVAEPEPDDVPTVPLMPASTTDDDRTRDDAPSPAYAGYAAAHAAAAAAAVTAAQSAVGQDEETDDTDDADVTDADWTETSDNTSDDEDDDERGVYAEQSDDDAADTDVDHDDVEDDDDRDADDDDDDTRDDDDPHDDDDDDRDRDDDDYEDDDDNDTRDDEDREASAHGQDDTLDDDSASEAQDETAEDDAAAATTAGAATAPAFISEGDDLQRIRAIDADMEQRLKTNGVLRFLDIAKWTPDEIELIDVSLDLEGRIDREQWVEQAQILAKGGETYYSRNRSTAVRAQSAMSSSAAASTSGGEASGDVEGDASDDGEGDDSDSSREAVGTAGKSVAELAAAAAAAIAAASASVTRGIKPIEPISPLSKVDPNVAIPARITDAIRERERQSSSVPDPDSDEPELPPTNIVPDAEADDLKRIRGVGVLIEKRLNALGISRYEQIANWSNSDVERISKKLEFGGRIEREGWIQQARILASGGQTEFSRRFDRGEVDN